MAIDIYELVIPVMSRMATNIEGFLAKGEEFAQARGLDPAELLEARLAPDMFTFTRQVQIATDFCKATPSRLAGIEVPKWDDNEQSFAELHARVRRALEYLAGFDRSQFEGAENRPIQIDLRIGPIKFTGKSYLIDFALPNFYFHTTAAYAILRHRGVDLGKRDFLGPVGEM